MRKVNIQYCVNSYEKFNHDLKKIIHIFTQEGDVHLEINLVMDEVDGTDVKKVINSISKYKVFKEITNGNIFTFVLTLSPENANQSMLYKIRGLISGIDLVYKKNNMDNIISQLRKKKIPCSVLVRESAINQVANIYEEMSKKQIPIIIENFEQFEFSSEFMSYFKEWFYDKKGCRINLFADILSRILLDYWGTRCQYNSCLTKQFKIDADGNIYVCKKKQNLICKLDEVISLQNIVSNEKFVDILKQSIDKREECKRKCRFYEYCQGGCPLNCNIQEKNCMEKKLFYIMEDIKQLLYEAINYSDYGELNPAVREMILFGVASNKVFEKGLIG